MLVLQAIAAMDKVDVIRSFDGTTEIATWLKKLKLVAKLKKITDIASFIPLYLEGSAFAVYDQLDDISKEDGEAIEKLLLSAFGQNKFAAYDSFRQRSWMPGEAVDVYLSELRRLARLAEVESDELIKCAFVCGLPIDVSSKLRAEARTSKAGLSVLVDEARVLMDERVQGAMAAVGRSKNKKDATGSRSKIECYECGGNHIARYCKQRKPIVCWKCEEPGHVARNCGANRQHAGNDSGKLPAPTVSRME